MKVLVAIDGSDSSRSIAHTLQAFSPFDQIHLLHTIQVPQLAYPGTGMSVGHEFFQEAQETLQVQGSQMLGEMVSTFPKHIGPIQTHLQTGPPAEVILSLAEQEYVDLIIIGSRGLGWIREHALGSVSHRVTTHAPCSTLVVKTGRNQFKHILLPIGHQEDADHAISFLSTNPFHGHTQVTLLHVIPFAQPILPMGALLPEAWRKDVTENAELFIHEIATRIASMGYATSTLVFFGAPSAVILEHTDKLQPDLILMGVQKMSRLNRILLGSVSHSIIHHAACSVLLVK